MSDENILIVLCVAATVAGIFKIAMARSKVDLWLVMGRDIEKKTTYVAGVFDNHDAAWKFCHHCSTLVVDDVFYLDREKLNKPLGDEKVRLGKRRLFINGKMTTLD
uniref:Uncharacterized protein n=1 Tax=Serratia phage Spe5P4 TaxID=3159438 RepID=A0AAU7VHD3_9CAUD